MEGDAEPARRTLGRPPGKRRSAGWDALRRRKRPSAAADHLRTGEAGSGAAPQVPDAPAAPERIT